MEQLSFEFADLSCANALRDTVIVGVVGSGQVEVLMEPAKLAGRCEVEIETSVAGFAGTWEAVLRDFVARHPLGNARISINDGGATPATVVLRLEQAAAEFLDA